METEATQLTVEDGKVVGVVAHKADGTTVTVKAKAVILATGGFGGSSELQEQYLGQTYKFYGMAQNNGGGISMATTVGAGTYNIDMPPMSHFVAPEQIDVLRTQGLSADASGRYLSQGGVKADTPLTNIDAVLEEGIKQGFGGGASKAVQPCSAGYYASGC